MSTGINPLPLTFKGVEGAGIRLEDESGVSDVWHHSRLAAAIERNQGQIRVFTLGKRLIVQGMDGRFVESIPGEELVSSLHRNFAGRRVLGRGHAKIVARVLNR